MWARRAQGLLVAQLLVASAEGTSGTLQEGLYTIRNMNSGRYLDVEGGSQEVAANVLLWDTPSAMHSQWVLRAAEDGTSYTIQKAQSGLFLSTPATGTSFNGANAFVWSSRDLPESLWKLHLVSQADGMTFSVENVKFGRFLSVAGASAANGANVHLWSSPGKLESQWQFLSKGVCRDATVGDLCYNDTIWAKDYAIHTRPEWYPGLTSTSSLADFQAHLHYCFWGRCPMPCASTALHSCQMTGRFWSSSGCEDAAQGSTCHQEVSWAMDYGIKQHPEWYPSLSNQSSFGEFQARLYKGKEAGMENNHCPEPCCHDAFPGERCHEDAMWAMLYGINIPEVSHWYPPSLTNVSSFADFQAYLHLCSAERCPEPCTATEILARPHNVSMDCMNVDDMA